MTGPPGQGCQHRTATVDSQGSTERRGQPEKDSQNGKGRTGLPGQGYQHRTARILLLLGYRKIEKERKARNRTAKTGQPERDGQNRASRAGLPAQNY
jgi:hypothetical protein